MTHNIIVERDVMITMRDGVKLAADIYRPDNDATHPTLVNLHPYDNDMFLVVHELLFSPLIAAQKGYAVVTAESRGRAGSEGEWKPYGEEGKDAYDVVEWAADQSWSDSHIGLYGACALGLAAIQGAVEAPPHLKAVFAYMTATNFHNGWTYSKGGALELGFQMSWVWKILARDTLSRLDLAPDTLEKASQQLAEAEADMNGSASYLPLIDFPPFQNGAAPYWREWLSHPNYDEFWQKVDNVAHASSIKVPILHLSAWYDTCMQGHMDLNAALRKNSDPQVRNQHRMIIGPTDHSAYYNKRPSYAGERDFGPEALTGPDIVSAQLFEWFDHWLRDEPQTFMPENAVRYYHMGENSWQETQSWPPQHTIESYYLHSAGQANSRLGNGTLSTEPPGTEPADSFVYDPLDPVPTTGGRSMIDVPTGIMNQSQLEERQDILVYTTPRLAKALVLTGPLSVTLYASSDAEDTDFTAKLVDVEPDGYCANIAEGIIRARYRNGAEKEEFLEPNKVTAFTIDLWDIAHTVKPNHQLRLEISSSNFPRFDRNLNSRITPALGSVSDAQKAVQQIFHNAEHPSSLNLPITEPK